VLLAGCGKSDSPGGSGFVGKYRAAGPGGPAILEVAEHDGVVTLTKNGQTITGK
jgi:hypothetical protein